MFERRSEALISRAAFLLRFARHGLAALGLSLGSLAVGVAGYHFLVCPSDPPAAAQLSFGRGPG